MLQISRPDTGISLSQQAKTTSSSSSESKKYTKRRYTDSRHQTRHIPDSDTLAGKNTVSVSVSSSSSVTISSASSAAGGQNQRGGAAQPVWKRRELISSAPKDREGYFWTSPVESNFRGSPLFRRPTFLSPEHNFFVSIFWQCLKRIEREYRIFLHW